MGGSCFEQLGDAPSPGDRELPELDNFFPVSLFPVQSQPASSSESNALNPAAGPGSGGALFELDGPWPTAEHYFQAAKHPQDEQLRERIRAAPTCTGPGGCFQLGNQGGALRPDWEVVKVDVMYAANLAKYTQAPGLRELLVSARGRIRAKGAQDMWATWNEVLLERIREELREGPDRDAIVLAERVAMMAAYQAAARGLPGEHAERAVTAITRQAAKRELQPAVLGGPAAAAH